MEKKIVDSSTVELLSRDAMLDTGHCIPSVVSDQYYFCPSVSIMATCEWAA